MLAEALLIFFYERDPNPCLLKLLLLLLLFAQKIDYFFLLDGRSSRYGAGLAKKKTGLDLEHSGANIVSARLCIHGAKIRMVQIRERRRSSAVVASARMRSCEVNKNLAPRVEARATDIDEVVDAGRRRTE